jgi:hypothetical protein
MSEAHLDLSDSGAIPDTSVSETHSETEREPDSSETTHFVIEQHQRERVPSLDILSLVSCFLAIGALILLHSLYVRDPNGFACLPVDLILKENPDLITIQIVGSHDAASSGASMVVDNKSEIKQSPPVEIPGTNRTGRFNVWNSLASKFPAKKILHTTWNASVAAFRRIGKRSQGANESLGASAGPPKDSANNSDRKASHRADGLISIFNVREHTLRIDSVHRCSFAARR